MRVNPSGNEYRVTREEKYACTARGIPDLVHARADRGDQEGR